MQTKRSLRVVAGTALLVGVTSLLGCDGINDPRPGVTAEIPSAPLTAHATATPSNGGAPFQVTLDGWGSSGQIVLYEWDLNGDGQYDWSSTRTGETTHVINKEGLHLLRLRITDDTGATATTHVNVCVAEEPSALICADEATDD